MRPYKNEFHDLLYGEGYCHSTVVLKDQLAIFTKPIRIPDFRLWQQVWKCYYHQTDQHQCNNNTDQSQQILYYHSTVSIRFTSGQIFTRMRSCYHITVTIRYLTVRVHLQVIAATGLLLIRVLILFVVPCY